MDDSLFALMAICMVFSPCLVARLICISHDRAALIMVQPEPECWE